MNNGYVWLWRKTLQWPWFKQVNVTHLFIYCLLKASRLPREQTVGTQSVHLDPGQLVFGRKITAQETGLSEQQVRTALVCLTRANCLKYAVHSTRLFSIVSVCNWESYQAVTSDTNQPINQPPTNLQPTFNQPPTTDKNVKKGNKGKKVKKTALAAKPPAKRKPDPWWDTICDVFGLTAITDTDGRRIGKLKREFKAKCEHAGCGPEEIRRRRENLIDRWDDPDMATPEATLKWWDLAGTTTAELERDNEANPRCRRPDEDCLPMGGKMYAEIFGGPVIE